MKTEFEPREVSAEEVREICRHGSCQILDVRGLESCQTERIEGAMCLPLDELEEKAKLLDRDALIVAYCSGPQCPASGMAEKALYEKGFCAVHYKGGIAGWKEAGLKTVSG